ncbi:MAG TPA: hypothetical protein VK616_14445 [Flavitalea sp.]|nr:hypothetical protein [Flavitalea sp.]
MKRYIQSILFGALCLTFSTSHAQDFDKAGDYLSYIGQSQKELGTKYLSYISASSHGKNMRKIEKRRSALIESINDTRTKIFNMPSFNGDKSLRDSAVTHLKLLYSVFNEDYSKIVNMEEIAEQSYDNMEAYLLAKDKVSEKLGASSEAYDRTEKEFAAKNDINLLENQSELSRKLKAAGETNDYYNTVYLIFFKASVQESYLIEALSAKNTSSIEQNRSTLIKYSSEGLEKLKSMKGYNSDKSLENACKKALEFYIEEAEKKIPILSDFIISSENFELVKKAYENGDKNKQAVDNYNKSVNELNKSVNTYNNVNRQLNDSRSSLVSNYNTTVESFLDTHMPHAN